MLFLIGGICVGLAAVLMAALADEAQRLFKAMLAPSPSIAVVITPIGFGLCAWLAHRAFPNSQGSGTGVLQAPITAFVIVGEMIQAHAMMIPLMLAALIADVVSKLVCREALYNALAAILLARAQAEAPQ